jgi:hypothetical protein
LINFLLNIDILKRCNTNELSDSNVIVMLPDGKCQKNIISLFLHSSIDKLIDACGQYIDDDEIINEQG